MSDAAVSDFTLPSTGGTDFSLSAVRGRPVVLYFYPKDNTPGCTTEALQFRDLHDEYRALGATVLGISRDSLKAQEGFKARQGFPFDLVADTDEALSQAFGVIKLKQMYGKQVRGIERSTFLIDADGVLRREWRGVKVAGHVAEVLEALSTLGR